MENPHSYPWKEPPTAEDYELACKTIEELEALAEKEPVTEKVLLAIARLAQSTGKGVSLLAMGLCEAISFPPPNPEESETIKLRNELAQTKTKFWDAARRLREVEKAGRDHNKYGVK